VASSTNSDDKDEKMLREDIVPGMVNCQRLVLFFFSELNTTTNSIIILLKGSTLSPCLFLLDVVTLAYGMLSEEGSLRGQIIALGSSPFVGASCIGCYQRKGLGHCHNKQFQTVP